MNKFILILGFTLFAFPLQGQEISGDWYGNLKVMGQEIPLIFHISEVNSGYTATMDSPEQGGFGIPVSSVLFESDSLKLSIPAAGITYHGKYLSTEKTIRGIFKQGGLSLEFNLSKEKPKKEELVRPQEPKPPFPYVVKEVKFRNAEDNITLSGTLSLPSQKGHFPAVILISGSGPQDRNSEIFGHKAFLVISDYLTRNGIAVLRFDDRGVGKSEGDFSIATTYDFASDVTAALEYLKSQMEINPKKIGLIGHSEGGIIAPLIANERKDVDFMVLLAAPALRGAELMLLQKKILEEKSGEHPLAVAKSQEIFKGAYDLILNSEENNSELQNELQDYFSGQLGAAVNEEQIKAIVAGITTPWMLSFIKYDPATALEKLEVPVLAVFGENDFQVPPEINS
ncbi:MAG TPA: alpha/beta fold hydrolase, partial [Salinimicrobium sp.]|nr:alpha/beta fold hydrolase [Salinimicrobium sp.]